MYKAFNIIPSTVYTYLAVNCGGVPSLVLYFCIDLILTCRHEHKNQFEYKAGHFLIAIRK